MGEKLKEPHLLNINGNPFKVLRNLEGILTPEELERIRKEINSNATALFRLGNSHFNFSKAIASEEWRQRVSRSYYGVYNMKRAVTLVGGGGFSADSSDHAKIDVLPDGFENTNKYKAKFKQFREDRNLADYNHLAVVNDLVNTPEEYETLVSDFLQDAKKFLSGKGWRRDKKRLPRGCRRIFGKICGRVRNYSITLYQRSAGWRISGNRILRASRSSLRDTKQG